MSPIGRRAHIHVTGEVTYTWTRLGAALEVLRLRGQPMTPSEIVEIGHKNRFFEKNDRRIVGSVNASLSKASKEAQPIVVSLGDGRYALAEWGIPVTPRNRGVLKKQRVSTLQNDIVGKLDERLREIQDYLDGKADLNPDRVCLLIELCYLLELDEQAVDLFLKLPRGQVDADWLRRVDRLVRVCRHRMGQ